MVAAFKKAPRGSRGVLCALGVPITVSRRVTIAEGVQTPSVKMAGVESGRRTVAFLVEQRQRALSARRTPVQIMTTKAARASPHVVREKMRRDNDPPYPVASLPVDDNGLNTHTPNIPVACCALTYFSVHGAHVVTRCDHADTTQHSLHRTSLCGNGSVTGTYREYLYIILAMSSSGRALQNLLWVYGDNELRRQGAEPLYNIRINPLFARHFHEAVYDNAAFRGYS